MKKLFITLIILFSQLVGSVLAQTQQRDRRAELDIDCSSNFCISTTGQLWISTYCGKIFTADSISSTWRTVKFPIEQSDSDDYEQKPDGFESMATFGNQTAVAVGFSNSWDDYAYVLRTKDCGQHWDTVLLDSNLAGVRTCFSRSEGYIWIRYRIVSAIRRCPSAFGCSRSVSAKWKYCAYSSIIGNRPLSAWRSITGTDQMPPASLMQLT